MKRGRNYTPRTGSRRTTEDDAQFLLRLAAAPQSAGHREALARMAVFAQESADRNAARGLSNRGRPRGSRIDDTAALDFMDGLSAEIGETRGKILALAAIEAGKVEDRKATLEAVARRLARKWSNRRVR